LGFIFDEGQGVKRIAEIGLEGLFQPVDVFHGVVGVLNIMKVIETVILLFVGDDVGV
jgi:hypothetical protein